MFTLSQKTIKRPNSRAVPNSYLALLPPLPVCFKCCVSTKHTGGKCFCPKSQISTMNHCHFIG